MPLYANLCKVLLEREPGACAVHPCSRRESIERPRQPTLQDFGNYGWAGLVNFRGSVCSRLCANSSILGYPLSRKQGRIAHRSCTPVPQKLGS